MVGEKHTENTADAATKDGKQKQGNFRNPPSPFPGFPFVESHQEKGDQIDRNNIGYDDCVYTHTDLRKLFVVLFILYFQHLHGTNLCRKTKQVDEAFCIMMVIHITGCKACNAFII